MKKVGGKGRPEILSRDVEISSFRATVRLHAVHPRGEEPYIESRPWLELRGAMTEAVGKAREVMVSMYPEDQPKVGTARPAAVGAIIQTRPYLGLVLTWTQIDFDRLWALALAGRLTHGHLHFTKPHYNTALVLNASFSNEAEE